MFTVDVAKDISPRDPGSWGKKITVENEQHPEWKSHDESMGRLVYLPKFNRENQPFMYR